MLLRYKDVFAMKDSMKNDPLCVFLLIDDTDVPVYLSQHAILTR